jgi:hypothetical protein
MKTLKFKPHLVEQILTGTKTSTWRLFDDKNIMGGICSTSLTKKPANYLALLRSPVSPSKPSVPSPKMIGWVTTVTNQTKLCIPNFEVTMVTESVRILKSKSSTLTLR